MNKQQYTITFSSHNTILGRGVLNLESATSRQAPQGYLTNEQLHQLAFKMELGMQDCVIDDTRIRVHISIPTE
jgi:hypothetical protein